MPIDIQNIENLEEYFAKLQKIELIVGQEDAYIDKIVKSYAINPAFYTGATEINKLRRDLESYLKWLTKESGDTGKLMARKAMGTFLEKSERRDITQKQLRIINQLNKRQIDRRTLLFKKQIGKETNYLKSEIDEFFINAKISGRTKKDVLKELTKAASDDVGLATGFAKKQKRIAIDAARREAQQRAMMEYRKIAKPGEPYQWISISARPCPDCSARAGVTLSWQEWQVKGTPGSGRTICGASCKCQLMPVSVAEDMFPDVKTFKWDKEKLVLTTFGEARTFKTHGVK